MYMTMYRAYILVQCSMGLRGRWPVLPHRKWPVLPQSIPF